MGLGLMKIKLLTHYRLKTEEIFLLLENPPQAFDVSGVSEYTVGSIMVRNRIFYIEIRSTEKDENTSSAHCRYPLTYFGFAKVF